MNAPFAPVFLDIEPGAATHVMPTSDRPQRAGSLRRYHSDLLPCGHCGGELGPVAYYDLGDLFTYYCCVECLRAARPAPGEAPPSGLAVRARKERHG